MSLKVLYNMLSLEFIFSQGLQIDSQGAKHLNEFGIVVG